ncbi:outer membrane protein assembly factor [Nitrogeniibacter mangrovi]|uniref:Outer membrane protein assembly factor n=1 Tax=Nitrogeniibacter mangrovi TaxID=2016596 RepID=A0A6C1B4C7_9RHOO|nr:autotransporter assembly complex family protein [Nitrogeniibacter mangrovi]QID18556.1 outer membrane protein assembly factor [Nitrogeniibacter mangrovi]
MSVSSRAVRLFVLMLCCAAPVARAEAPVTLDVAAPLRPLLDKHLTVLREDAIGADPGPREQQALVRRARSEITGLLATEGYFSPTIRREGEGMPVRLRIDAGPRTHIDTVDIRFAGQIERAADAERRARIEQAWPLKPGLPFRQADWDAAKGWLLDEVSVRDFPAARFTETEATIDPAAQAARLQLVVDSGPAYTMGELHIDGLSEYDAQLVRRYNPIAPGAPYDRDALLDLQRALQATPYFASVRVSLPTDGATEQVPIDVALVEAKPRRIEFGAGYSSNNGYRAETSYRDANLFDRGWQLDTGLRLEQRHQLLFADVFLPPARGGGQDSFGAQSERTRAQGLTTQTLAIGAARRHQRGNIETHLALKLQREIYSPDGAERTRNKALTLNWTWTLRQVDDLFNPRDGYVISGQIGGGAKAAFSDQNFLRLSGRVAWYHPVGERDVVLLRAEGGMTRAPGRDGIPQDFLFRTGGAQSVRGYQYNSLGVREGDAVVGGRYLAVLGAEYTHWWANDWGVAAFVDAGDAADERARLSLKRGYGVGARWRSPAGPLAADLAYGEADRRVRLHFSIAIAF